jgi:uncharacterized repeat protein (TIGR02543 family)
MISNSRKHPYVARVSIFLIMAALIAGMVGCEPVVRYNLAVSSTEGGKVVSPGEGTFSCYGKRGVNLIAASNIGYHFVGWTGDVSTVADVNSTATTITMCGNYSIMANFEKSVGGSCFIATAAYGTPMAEEIQILREFRDRYLLTNALGQGLIDIYYRISPPIADFITEHPGLKPIVRAGLVPVVAMCSIVFEIIPQFAGNEA